MKTKLAIASTIVCWTSLYASAQGPPAAPEPTPQHKWLERFVGEWETESNIIPGPGAEKVACKGTISSRLLGGRWMVSDLKSKMFGTTVTAVQQIGYDPKTKKYVGTWVDSTSAYLWNYTGSVDKSGLVLTIEAEGPNITTPGATAKYQDSYDFSQQNRIRLTSKMQVEGKWVTFVEGVATRKRKTH